jgi:hypothetical protein
VRERGSSPRLPTPGYRMETFGMENLAPVRRLLKVSCPLDAAEVQCVAFDRRMAESIRAALDTGEAQNVEEVLDMMAWIDERRAVAAACASMN